jgi:hypothetical protein
VCGPYLFFLSFGCILQQYVMQNVQVSTVVLLINRFKTLPSFRIVWGCASKSNISIIQRSQSKILRMIANAPWYVPNISLHEDLNVPLVKEVIKQRSTIYQNKIEGHVNVLIQPLLQPHNQRRLKRNWPADLREG